ncbi:MAG: carbohydrate porin [Alphaproteobacteria bacterium]|nr:carbohydrate porin [Alphaproteobacteria bacterium]
MRATSRINPICAAVFSSLLVVGAPAVAYDVTDKFSVGGVLAGAVQCQLLDGDSGESDRCRGAVPVQPEASFRPTDADEVFIKFGFAADNALNADTPFALTPWAADLEADVKNINGRDRDYLLTAWYRHDFSIAEDSKLGVTFGIIDATDYLDDNAYANDEYTQFMNGGFVNAVNAFLPSYDIGGVVQFDAGAWSVRGVFMDVGENDDGNGFQFFGGQVGYTVKTPLGEGTYRAVITGTTDEFLNTAGNDKKSLVGGTLSFDQALSENVGAWIRIGWQDDSAAVDFDSIYTGGINIAGKPWGRPDDNIGIGYGFFNGGNLEIDSVNLVEAYYRFAVNEIFAISGDVQYMDEDRNDDGSPRGFILGLRATAEF